MSGINLSVFVHHTIILDKRGAYMPMKCTRQWRGDVSATLAYESTEGDELLLSLHFKEWKGREYDCSITIKPTDTDVFQGMEKAIGEEVFKSESWHGKYAGRVLGYILHKRLSIKREQGQELKLVLGNGRVIHRFTDDRPLPVRRRRPIA